VQEVRVQAPDVVRQPCREHQRLAEAADAVRRRIAPQIPQPDCAGLPVARFPSDRQPGAQYAQRLAQQVLRQVTHRGADLVVDRMPARVGRLAQRDDDDVQAAALERGDLLGDERLREAWIPLENESNAQVQ
jgi:hypothetical protein